MKPHIEIGSDPGVWNRTPYGHWNYKPAAADIWNFLSRYGRDMTTGGSIY
jgi:hypothetical protein